MPNQQIPDLSWKIQRISLLIFKSVSDPGVLTSVSLACIVLDRFRLTSGSDDNLSVLPSPLHEPINIDNNSIVKSGSLKHE